MTTTADPATAATSTVVDTANYFTVAVSDDRENASASASGSSTPATGPVGEDKAARKARRIVEAVERSKREYVADNVYTERRVSQVQALVTRHGTESYEISGSWNMMIEVSRKRKSTNKD